MPKSKKYLFDLHPHLRERWDYDKNVGTSPETLLPKSHKTVWWRCVMGHSFDAIVHHYSRPTTAGCPVCTGKRIMVGYNDLETTDPQLSKELVGSTTLNANNVTRGSNKKATWQCALGHQWETVIASRGLNGTGCPYCSNVTVLQGFNDLGTKRPDLASQLFDLNYKASDLLFRSTSIVTWRCGSGHVYRCTVRNREKGSGCGICKNTELLVGFNDIGTVYPHLVSELKTKDEAKLICTHRQALVWVCERNHEYSCTVYRRSKGTGCAYCKKKKLLSGFNDLASVDPILASELVSHDPSTIIEGSAQMLRWRCSLEHEWDAVASSRKQGVGCPYCSNTKVLTGYNDLASQCPELLQEWSDTINPRTIGTGSHAKVQWKCKDGHLWVAEVKSRALYGGGCPVCHNKMVLRGYNDLATTHPNIAAQLVDVERAYKLTIGSSSKERWKCTKNHEWITAVHNRSRGTECPKCSFQKTSRIEGRLRDLMSKVGNLISEDHTYYLDVPYRRNKKMSVDIYLEVGNHKLVCEYDGFYFHDRPASVLRDIDKTKALLSAGYLIVRVRESPLTMLEIIDDSLLQISAKYNREDDNLVEAVEKIKAWLEEKNE